MITVQRLTEMLNDYPGATFVTIETRTIPKLIAANPFRGNIVKIARVNGMINWIYTNSVNRQRVRENLTPDFVAFPRKWGTRMQGPNGRVMPLVEHRGQYYLELKVERSVEYRYETLDGQPLDTATVNEYLPGRGPSRQGVENEIILRDYSVDNITAIQFRGEYHQVAA